VWLGHLHGKPLFLYATSAGPFENRLLNPFRRWLYRRLDVVCVRESQSAAYVETLLGEKGRELHVTADSALQQTFEARPRDDYFTGECADLAQRTLVAVSALDHRYAGTADPRAQRERYDHAMVETLQRLAHEQPCHFMLIPQLYGGLHTDVPYLEKLAGRLGSDVSWEIVDPKLDSDAQRRLFAMADVCVASRYHPAIFSQSAGVPAVCIYYEHKALGFMEQLGLERFAFDIREVDADDLVRALRELLDRRADWSDHLRREIPALRARACRTTDLAVELIAEQSAEQNTGQGRDRH
jgi:polysaccharide pyruvyl transferase WcaK-like protein